MNRTYTLDKEFIFPTTIYEITSISIDHNYDIVENTLEGTLNVSGDYRIHEISINKEDFSFKIPINEPLESNINLDTVEFDITDFTYELVNNDELHVHITYVISGEQNLIEFDSEPKLDEFLNNNDVEVVDLTEDRVEDNKIEEDIIKNIKTEDAFVKYHVHTVTMNDSLESICQKYKVNLNTLKKYNTFDNLELNMKLLIPENEED